MHRFVASWFDRYGWLEYSVERDAAFCFVCYLFKDNTTCTSGDDFVNGGFRNWNEPDKFEKHIGGINSAHNQAQGKYDLFVEPGAPIIEHLHRKSMQDKVLSRTWLTHSLKCFRCLLHQRLACCGHNEGPESSDDGNFLELLNGLAENFEVVAKVFPKHAMRNNKMTFPCIQKDIINCFARETTRFIVQDLGDDYFSILAYESNDSSQKEHLALCLRYVDKSGEAVERFLGSVHVEDTTALTLKSAIQSVLMDHSLSLSKVCWQGYYGASNMKGEVSGLRKLIMDEASSAYYVHCFAHRLHLTLVAAAKENGDCVWFFEQLSFLFNIIGISHKKQQFLQVAEAQEVLKAFELGEIKNGWDLDKELDLSRPGHTRLGSHYKAVIHVISLYSSIRQVLVMIGEDHSQRMDAINSQTMLTTFESFDFIFMAHLLMNILGYAEDLSRVLHQGDPHNSNALDFIDLTKDQLELLCQDDAWDMFLKDVTSFCVKHGIKVPNMDDLYRPVSRSPRIFRKVKNLHLFHVEMYLTVMNRQHRELDDRFDEVSTKLLACMAAFDPTNSFASFDKTKLITLAQFYPKDLSSVDLAQLPFQLDLFISDVGRDERFEKLKSIFELSIMLVETNKHRHYKLVYLLLKLVLILPVATASVERVFSAMNFVKSKLRNRTGNQYLNDCLVTYLERDFLLQVKDDDIISSFQGKTGCQVTNLC